MDAVHIVSLLLHARMGARRGGHKCKDEDEQGKGNGGQTRGRWRDGGEMTEGGDATACVLWQRQQQEDGRG